MSTKKSDAATTPANDATEKKVYANRGRNVPGWLEKNFGEGTGKDWPRSLDEMWPLLQAKFRERPDAFSLRDVRCEVRRLGSAAGGETPVAPPFDASCMDTDTPAAAAQQYLEDFYHLPAAEAGVGAAMYRIAFKDKKTGQQIIAGEMPLLHPREILAIRKAHGLGSNDAPAYAVNPPVTSTRAAPVGVGAGPTSHHDPYVVQALNDFRVELAQQKAQTPEVIAGVLKALGHTAAPTPTASAPTPAAPASSVEQTVEVVIEVLRRAGIAKDVHANGAAPADQSLSSLADKMEEAFKTKDRVDAMISRYVARVTGVGGGPAGAAPEPTQSASTEVETPKPEEKAPFRGLKIDGQPKYKDQDVLWPVDHEGNFSFKGIPFTNPQLWGDFMDLIREGGKPAWELFARFMEQQGGVQRQAPAASSTTNGAANGASHVTSDVPAGARDANPGDGSNGYGNAS